jgi:hypothetical protein
MNIDELYKTLKQQQKKESDFVTNNGKLNKKRKAINKAQNSDTGLLLIHDF